MDRIIEFIEANEAGSKLRPGQAKDLMKQIRNDPDDIIKRLKILGYYDLHPDTNLEDRKNNKIWLVLNYPRETHVLHCALSHDPDSEEYSSLREVWLHQVESNSNDATILLNVASFFFRLDDVLALQILQKAAVAEPNNSLVASSICRFYLRQAIYGEPELAKERYLHALEFAERCYALSEEEASRFYALSDLAESAFGANKIEYAREIANKMLTTARKFPKDWNYGNAIYDANITLGKIKFQEGDIDAAMEFLIAASLTPGSPQLNSFGPELDLCARLLAKGKLECAKEFLGNCSKFWEEKLVLS